MRQLPDETPAVKKGLHNSIFAKGFRFLKYNRFWTFTFRAIVLSAFYRLSILLVNPNKLHKYWGAEGEESDYEDVSMDIYRYAYKVSYAVDKVCTRVAWESKCLVRALTAQHMLKKKGYPTTLYLGCQLEDGKMIAHAWLRCGKMYVTGGNGEGYSIVDKFRA